MESSRCLHCDCHSSGNCVLQHYAMVYGADASRFRAERRKFEQHAQPGGIIFEPGKCILCGICVDACPYDALRCGPDYELSHENRGMPIVDLLATSSIDRDTEITWIRNERDWAERASAQGRFLDSARMLPVLPANVAGNGHSSNGNGHVHDGNGQHAH